MRIFAISDLHGNERAVRKLAALIIEECPDEIIFLGDGARDALELESLTDRRIIFVRGNCDLMSFLPDERVLMFEHVRTIICHGHTYGVKTGYGRLESAAGKHECSLALSGHTHQPLIQQRENVLIVNPGSAGAYFGASFADINIKDVEINAEIRAL